MQGLLTAKVLPIFMYGLLVTYPRYQGDRLLLERLNRFVAPLSTKNYISSCTDFSARFLYTKQLLRACIGVERTPRLAMPERSSQGLASSLAHSFRTISGISSSPAALLGSTVPSHFATILEWNLIGVGGTCWEADPRRDRGGVRTLSAPLVWGNPSPYWKSASSASKGTVLRFPGRFPFRWDLRELRFWSFIQVLFQFTPWMMGAALLATSVIVKRWASPTSTRAVGAGKCSIATDSLRQFEGLDGRALVPTSTFSFVDNDY